jgi:hypothetical protein
MPPTEQNGQIRDALRRFLPSAQSKQAVVSELDSSTAQALETKIADAFKKYPFFPIFKLRDRAGKSEDEANANHFINFVYDQAAPEGEAWIELPTSLVKAVFISALGGTFTIQSHVNSEVLTAAEYHFAEFLAQALCSVVAPINGKSALSRIVQSGPAEHLKKTNDIQQFRFAPTPGGSDISFQISPFATAQDAGCPVKRVTFCRRGKAHGCCSASQRKT